MCTPASSLQALLERFYRRTALGIRPGLEVARALVETLGHPERAYPVVHVAGTNGKGSVCAMLEALVRAHGLKTGLYTSPHLISFHERVRVNGRCISDEALAELLCHLETLADSLSREQGYRAATFFELGTALAFEHFRRERVELAVIETGMGGAWDATNVVDPRVAVITRVDLDHTQYLGDTLQAIAQEKSGVIKPGRSVVLSPMPDVAGAIMRQRARTVGARCVPAAENATVLCERRDWNGQRIRVRTASADYGPFLLPLLGSHQLENVAVAVTAFEELAEALGLEVEPRAVKAGLESVRWPARCQVLRRDPVVLLDGAHNPGGARVLREAWEELLPGRGMGLVAGCLADKDALGIMTALASATRKAWAVPVPSERALSPSAVAAAMRQAGIRDVVEGLTPREALEQAVGWADACGGAVCVTGSLYLAGEILRQEVGTCLFDSGDADTGQSSSRANGPK